MALLRLTSSGTLVPADQPRPDTRRARSTWAWTRESRAQRQRVPWCEECGATTDLTADHQVALAAGGALVGQSRTLCRSCNSSKGAA